MDPLFVAIIVVAAAEIVTVCLYIREFRARRQLQSKRNEDVISLRVDTPSNHSVTIVPPKIRNSLITQECPFPPEVALPNVPVLADDLLVLVDRVSFGTQTEKKNLLSSQSQTYVNSVLSVGSQTAAQNRDVSLDAYSPVMCSIGLDAAPIVLPSLIAEKQHVLCILPEVASQTETVVLPTVEIRDAFTSCDSLVSTAVGSMTAALEMKSIEQNTEGWERKAPILGESSILFLDVVPVVVELVDIGLGSDVCAADRARDASVMAAASLADASTLVLTDANEQSVQSEHVQQIDQGTDSSLLEGESADPVEMQKIVHRLGGPNASQQPDIENPNRIAVDGSLLKSFFSDACSQKPWTGNKTIFLQVWDECIHFAKQLESVGSELLPDCVNVLHVMAADQQFSTTSLGRFDEALLLMESFRSVPFSWILPVLFQHRKEPISSFLDQVLGKSTSWVEFVRDNKDALGPYLSSHSLILVDAQAEEAFVKTLQESIVANPSDSPKVYALAMSRQVWGKVLEDPFRSVPKCIVSFAVRARNDDGSAVFIQNAILDTKWRSHFERDIVELFGCDVFLSINNDLSRAGWELFCSGPWSADFASLSDLQSGCFERYLASIWKYLVPSPGTFLSFGICEAVLPSLVASFSDGSVLTALMNNTRLFCANSGRRLPFAARDSRGQFFSKVLRPVVNVDEVKFLSQLLSDLPRHPLSHFLRLRMYDISSDVSVVRAMTWDSTVSNDLARHPGASMHFWTQVKRLLFTAGAFPDLGVLNKMVLIMPYGSPFEQSDYVSILGAGLKCVQDHVSMYAPESGTCSAFLSRSPVYSLALEFLSNAFNRRVSQSDPRSFFDPSFFTIFSYGAVAASLVKSKDESSNILLFMMKRYPFLFDLDAKLTVFFDPAYSSAYFSSEVDRIDGLDRSSLFPSAFKVLYIERKRTDWKKKWKVRFAGDSENTIDIDGVKREFFTLLADQMRSEGNLFGTDGAVSLSLAPSAALENHFTFIGRLMAKALLERSTFDVGVSTSVYKRLLGAPLDLVLDFPDVAERIRQIKELPSVEGVLFEDGLSDATKYQYCEELEKNTLTGAEWAYRALSRGFGDLIPASSVRLFSAVDLQLALCGTASFDVLSLVTHTQYTQGYSSDAPAVGFLWNTLQEFSDLEKQKFLQFVTGSSRVPPGGFKSLAPKFTIQKIPLMTESGKGLKLPSASTCFHLLKWPEYKSAEDAKRSLRIAVEEGAEGFSFS
eukprot:ANDGO_08196.mRNA.1 E3 ubiquitin-protein ligase UPL1